MADDEYDAHYGLAGLFDDDLVDDDLLEQGVTKNVDKESENSKACSTVHAARSRKTPLSGTRSSPGARSQDSRTSKRRRTVIEKADGTDDRRSRPDSSVHPEAGGTADAGLTDSPVPMPKDGSVSLTQFMVWQTKMMMAQQRRDARQAEERRLERQVRERKEEAEKLFKLAKERMKEFTPGTAVESWCFNFNDTVKMFRLNKKQAMTLFFAKIPTDSTWVAEFRKEDEANEEEVDDVNRWIARLKRTYAQSHDAKLMVLRNMRQEVNEEADVFVYRYRYKARSIGSDWSTAEIINRMRDSVHPKWKAAYSVLSKGSKTYADCIQSLSQAMSDDMAAFRLTLAAAESSTRNDSEQKDPLPVNSADTVTDQRPPAQSSRSRDQKGQVDHGIVVRKCYECGIPGHFRRECPLLDYDLETLRDYVNRREGPDPDEEEEYEDEDGPDDAEQDPQNS